MGLFNSTLSRSIGLTESDINKTDITPKLINAWILLKYTHFNVWKKFNQHGVLYKELSPYLRIIPAG